MRNNGDIRRITVRRITAVTAVFLALLMSACAGGADTVSEAPTGPAETTRTIIMTPDESDDVKIPDVTDGETVQSAAVTETEPLPEIDPVRLSFVGMGDNIIYGCTFRQAETSGGKYDFLPIYKNVSSVIKNADIAFINQETPMCGEKYGYHTYPQFNSPQQVGRDLVTLGFDVVTFANNHMADMGYNSKRCVADMMDFTDTLDTFVIGLYRDEADFNNIRVYEKDGVKIAFLAYTYGTNLYKQQTEPSKLEGVYLPVYDEEKITRQVTEAKELADFVFVSIHWGVENTHNVSEEQTHYAELMADLGVDVILGHHPHVIQKIEWLEGENGHKTLCYYSLGNGLNAQDLLKNMIGITASFDIVVDNDGKRIENASCIPTFNVMKPRYKSLSLILLKDLTDDIASSHHCNSTDQKVTVQKAYDIVKNNIDAEFLPDYLK